MASERQIAANRLNARRSTGPKIPGRLRSRRNALKHGLTATTVVDVLEDDAEFKSFKEQIVSAYQPASAIHQELVRRLVSVLWRLRRAHAVETGLLSIQSEVQRQLRVPASQIDMLELFGLEDVSPTTDPDLESERQRTEATARAFLRLCNYNGEALDRLSRYEIALWRQAVQLIFMLDASLEPPPIR
jgi:hypothetical protein